MISLPVLLVVGLTASVQSMFGVGVLLFGTPALLILGHPFATALGILLPVSLTINILQVVPKMLKIKLIM